MPSLNLSFTKFGFFVKRLSKNVYQFQTGRDGPHTLSSRALSTKKLKKTKKQSGYNFIRCPQTLMSQSLSCSYNLRTNQLSRDLRHSRLISPTSNNFIIIWKGRALKLWQISALIWPLNYMIPNCDGRSILIICLAKVDYQFKPHL